MKNKNFIEVKLKLYLLFLKNLLMKIRKATKKDLPEIVEISKGLLDYHVQFAKYYAPVKNSKERKKHHRKYFGKMIKARNSKMWVADDGKVIGYAIAKIIKNPPVLKEKHHGDITEVYIISKYRGRGIAGKLIKEALSWFKKREIKRVVVIFDTRNKAAKKAYKKAGFRPFQEKHELYLK
jgi:ribosomal protein S18 acetylase RimI-like enzyme